MPCRREALPVGLRRRLEAFFSTIRRRVLVFSLGTVTLLGLVSIYSQVNAQWMLHGVWQVYERQGLLVEIGATADVIGGALESYLASKGSESLLTFIKQSAVMERQLAEVAQRQVSSATGEGLKRTIQGLGREFLQEAQVAVNAKRGRDEERYAQSWERTQRIATYLQSELEQLGLQEYRASLAQASLFYQRLGLLQLSNAVMLFALLSLAILLSFWFSWRLSEPLESLSAAATEISRGNYDFELPPYGSDEAGRLTAAFSRMRFSIVRSIEEIRHTAEVENENLRMRTLLRNAEYQALQAQINPHFLFNTLNAAGQLAMMEDSPETEKFLNRLALLMRHNIRKLDQPVSLAEELQNLENYLYIMAIRFGDRVRFDIRRDTDVKGMTIPAMTLQPLVENALLHGLKDREADGLVSIRVLPPDAGWLGIEVIDNGVGMDPEVVQRVLEDVEGQEAPLHEEAAGQSTGIGMGNVIHRLQLYYGIRDVVRITSAPGRGTAILLRLPTPEVSHAENPDR
jgi:two-component system sensor histidine kinase YesM